MKWVLLIVCFIVLSGQVFCIPPEALPSGIVSRRRVESFFEFNRRTKELESLRKNPEELEQRRPEDLAKLMVGTIDESTDLGSLLCILELCRACVFSEITLDFFDRISDDVSAIKGSLCREALKSSVNDIQKYRVLPDLAEKLSLLIVFEVPWRLAVTALRELCKEGAFSHEYTLEEALFVVHMCPRRSRVDTFLDFWQKSKYEDDIVFYMKCLAGAMARVLKEEGKVRDFSFDIDISFTNKQLVVHNVKKLLAAYWGIPMEKTQDRCQMIEIRQQKEMGVKSEEIPSFMSIPES
jgi:hypothetical protein